MQTIILAAGMGTRLRPLTYTKPKVMLPLANKPILEHLVLELKKAGFEEIVFVVGYKNEKIRKYFKDGKRWGVRISYVTQKSQMGTADALKSAIHILEDEFLVINGDNIIESKDIEKLAKKSWAVGIKEVKNPYDFGVIEIEKNKIKKIVEKPEKPISNLINAGIYKFTKDIIEFLKKTPISKRGEYELTDTLQLAIDSGVEVKAVKISTWIDVSYPWDLLKANEFVLSKIEESVIKGKIENGAYVKGTIVLGENSIIKAGSYLVGPIVIGKNCKIGPNCFIRPYTSIGDDCHIGACVEIKNSIIMSNTNVPHLNYVGDSIIGEYCNLGAGTKIANLRLDEREVCAVVKGKKVPTGRRKFGAVIGDFVKIGINVSINVGTIIGNNVRVAPSAVVDGYIESNSKVF